MKALHVPDQLLCYLLVVRVAELLPRRERGLLLVSVVAAFMMRNNAWRVFSKWSCKQTLCSTHSLGPLLQELCTHLASVSVIKI